MTTHVIPPGVLSILESVVEERDKAMAVFGIQNHPDGTKASDINRQMRDDQRRLVNRQAESGESNWFDILMEEVLEAGAEEDLVALDKELMQVMQVACVWREDIQRRLSAGSPAGGERMSPLEKAVHDARVKDALGHALPGAPRGS